MMKRMLSLLLVLSLLLPVLAFGEEEDLDLEELIEEVDLDEGTSVQVSADEILSEEQQQELLETLESSSYTPTELDADNLYINPNLPDHVINILLLGLDTPDQKEGRVRLADVQLILSYDLDSGAIKLSSILRDTLVTNPKTGKNIPINESIQSYDANGKFYENPERSIAIINYNFETNIQYYATIKFHGVASIIQAIGGVDVDLTKAEAYEINYYLKKNRKSIARTYDILKDGETREPLEEKDGVQHLDGIQALMYARLRKSASGRYKEEIGGDWQRTYRTRHLMDLLLQKVLHLAPLDILDLAGEAIEYVNSNINIDTLGSLIMKVLQSGIVKKLSSSDSLIEQFRIPMGDAEHGDKTWGTDSDSGKIFMSRKNGNFQKNVEGLHEFIYGKYYPANP